MILNFCAYKEKQDYKKTVILNVLLNYYKNLETLNGVSIPYFLEAKKHFNEIIKSNKDINFYYKKIIDSEGKI